MPRSRTMGCSDNGMLLLRFIACIMVLPVLQSVKGVSTNADAFSCP